MNTFRPVGSYERKPTFHGGEEYLEKGVSFTRQSHNSLESAIDEVRYDGKQHASLTIQEFNGDTFIRAHHINLNYMESSTGV